jgi:hypothetical protein
VSADPVYSPPWLERLRQLDPDQAKLFDVDPRRMTKLDTLLNGVADAETKVAIVRTALNGGVDPDDPAIAFVIMATGISKLVGAEFTTMITSARIAAENGAEIVERIKAASENMAPTMSKVVDGAAEELEGMLNQCLAEIRSTSSAAISQIADTSQKAVTALSAQSSTLAAVAGEAKESLAALPSVATELVERVQNEARDAVNEHASKYASFTVAEESKKHSEAALADLRAAATQIHDVLEAIKPTRLLVERLREASSTVILGMKITARERGALLIGAIAGIVLGVLAFGFVANATYLGISPDLGRDARAGRFYLMSFPRITESCRAEFKKLAQSR